MRPVPFASDADGARLGWWLMAFAAIGMLLLILAGRVDHGGDLDGMASVVAPAAVPAVRPAPQAVQPSAGDRSPLPPQSQRRPRVRVILPEPLEGKSDVPRL